MWNIGSGFQKRSSCTSSQRSAAATPVRTRASWVSTQPFGLVVVPDVYISIASSRSLTRRRAACTSATGTPSPAARNARRSRNPAGELSPSAIRCRRLRGRLLRRLGDQGRRDRRAPRSGRSSRSRPCRSPPARSSSSRARKRTLIGTTETPSSGAGELQVEEVEAVRHQDPDPVAGPQCRARAGSARSARRPRAARRRSGARRGRRSPPSRGQRAAARTSTSPIGPISTQSTGPACDGGDMRQFVAGWRQEVNRPFGRFLARLVGCGNDRSRGSSGARDRCRERDRTRDRARARAVRGRGRRQRPRPRERRSGRGGDPGAAGPAGRRGGRERRLDGGGRRGRRDGGSLVRARSTSSSTTPG